MVVVLVILCCLQISDDTLEHPIADKEKLQSDKEDLEYACVKWYDESKREFRAVYIYFDSNDLFLDNNTDASHISNSVKEEIKNLLLDYVPTVIAGEDTYNPMTDEYPDMPFLFSFDLQYTNGKFYKAGGSLNYPDDWNMFVEDLSDIVNKK